MSNYNKKSGFIRLIILIVVGLLLLSYFHVDLRTVFTSNSLQDNINFIWNFSQQIWNDYIRVPLIFFLHSLLNLIQ